MLFEQCKELGVCAMHRTIASQPPRHFQYGADRKMAPEVADKGKALLRHIHRSHRPIECQNRKKGLK